MDARYRLTILIKPTPSFKSIVLRLALIPRGQPPSSQRVERVERHVVFAQTREQFVFDAAVECVVYALVYTW